MQNIVLATGNLGKVREITPLVAHLGWHIKAQSEYGVTAAEETGLTFIENAIIKARHASASTGLPALADDSGLCVEALSGAPGIISARFAGEDASDEENNIKLINSLKQLNHQEKFKASFHCALVYLSHENDPAPAIFEGKWEGEIILEPKGDEGFGYDPLFYIADLKKTAAQLTLEEKNLFSHRGIALKLLQRYFQQLRS